MTATDSITSLHASALIKEHGRRGFVGDTNLRNPLGKSLGPVYGVPAGELALAPSSPLRLWQDAAGKWRITRGWVAGLPIEGTGENLLELIPGGTLLVAAEWAVEFAENGGSGYATGRIAVSRAWLTWEGGDITDFPEAAGTGQVRRHYTLTTISAAGLPGQIIARSLRVASDLVSLTPY